MSAFSRCMERGKLKELSVFKGLKYLQIVVIPYITRHKRTFSQIRLFSRHKIPRQMIQNATAFSVPELVVPYRLLNDKKSYKYEES